MIHTADGTLLYSPRDLVAYLEGDFAAWCEREAPRGAEFLLSPSRLNVAVSRAEALAIVVGSPELTRVRCRSVEEMKLVNLLCHLMQYAEE